VRSAASVSAFLVDAGAERPDDWGCTEYSRNMGTLSWFARISIVLMLFVLFVIGITATLWPRRIQQKNIQFLESTFPELQIFIDMAKAPWAVVGLRVVGILYVVMVLLITVVLLFFTVP
jgi:hypothetical protein